MSKCHGCGETIEGAAQIRVYHAQCDPQGRVEMLERALRQIHDLALMANEAFDRKRKSEAGEMVGALLGFARAALAYKPAQMKGREG